MSRIAVYRVFDFEEGELRGRTGLEWPGAELVAECRKIEGLSTERARVLAREHLSEQACMCGIHGYFDPNMVTGFGQSSSIDRGDSALARTVLGGLVDVHEEGARGEYALIEEMWAAPWIAAWLSEKFGVPVNRTPYEDLPMLEPMIDNDATTVLETSQNEVKAWTDLALQHFTLQQLALRQTTSRTIMSIIMGQPTPINNPLTGRLSVPARHNLRKDGRLWQTLEGVFADGAEHRRGEVNDYWHVRCTTGVYARAPLTSSGCRKCRRAGRYACTCVLAYGSGVREVMTRLASGCFIESRRHGFWQLTQAGRDVLANDGAFTGAGWRR